MLETLSRQNRERTRAERDFTAFQALVDKILLKRYLLSSRFEDFRQLVEANGVEFSPGLNNVLNNWDTDREPYQSQMQLIQDLVGLQGCDGVLGSLIEDIRLRFIAHHPFANVVATVESGHSLLRPAITFMIASNETRKVQTARDILPHLRTIDGQFRQVAEEIQNACPLMNGKGIRYWYQLDVFSYFIRDGGMGLDWQAAGGAIGWLIFLLDRHIDWNMPLLSIWGRYDAYRRQFCPVDGLREKLDACLEDGLRILAVPKSTLEEPIGPGLSFRDYAGEQKVHLIDFPDDLPMFDAYLYIFEKYQELELSSIGKAPDVEAPFYRVARNQGELLRDNYSDAYWVQNQKKYYISNPFTINHMSSHRVPGWEAMRKVHLVHRMPGPFFDTYNSSSDGLLIKGNQTAVFLIEDGQKRQIGDEYSFENYRHRGRLLEWGDIIWVTEEIVSKFNPGSHIQLTPILNCHRMSEPLARCLTGEPPALHGILNASPVTLFPKPHSNRSWAYHIQIAENREFTPLVDERTVVFPSWSIRNLMAGTYFWRVQGVKHGRVSSGWSEAWSFTISPHPS
ncbi:hypothetical protein HYR99_18035 [Candidatus Poribacteria bacterium]|nr:hypothetical protein [Candidatus Poribacteria bacterium]